MHALTTIDFIIRLATGVACGALIGVERQWRARMAGLRTNALVAAGAALFVLYGVAVGDPGSPTRVASYVVAGVGFLGGGVILRNGAGVRGLNTAATLWCSAAVGVLAASGHLDFALLGTAAVLAVHLVLRPVGRWLDRAPAAGSDPDTPVRATVHLVCERRAETHIRALLLHTLAAGGLAPTSLRAGREEDGEATGLRATVQITGQVAPALEQVIARLSLEPGVRDLHWHLHDEDEPEPHRHRTPARRAQFTLDARTRPVGPVARDRSRREKPREGDPSGSHTGAVPPPSALAAADDMGSGTAGRQVLRPGPGRP